MTTARLLRPTRSSPCAWRTASRGLAALALAAVAAAGAAQARPRHHCRHCTDFLPLLPPIPEAEGPPVNPPLPLPPEADIPPGARIPFQWDDRSGAPTISPVPPYTQGFVLTYTVHHDSQAKVAGALARYPDVGRALASCWSASAVTTQDWRDVTLRLSFKRDGSINGVPRVMHLDAPGDAGQQQSLRGQFLQALDGCAPLPLTRSLGAAIAGQIFAIRFIQKDS